MKCNSCGLPFNESDLAQVAYHEHSDLNIKDTFKSLRVIDDASDVYTGCSRKFACGVHSYLNGDPAPEWWQDSEFKRGYWQADSDEVIDKIKLNH